MITFGQHIEINKCIIDGVGLDEMFKDFNASDRVNFIRSIEEVYPISKDITSSDEFKDSFTVYDNVMDIHLGQFIMLEQIITGKENFAYDVDNDIEIAKLVIRPKQHKEFDNEDQSLEKENTDNILKSSVLDVYSSIYGYMKDREYVLFEQFSGVFYNVKDYDEEEQEEKRELIGEDLFNNQWYWYNIVRTLAQEDIRRYNEIYMLKMSTVLPEMSYLAQRNKIEQTKARQQRMSSKL